MRRAWWVCAAALFLVWGCGDDDGSRPRDAGGDSSQAGDGGTGGDAGTGGSGGMGGSGGSGATGGSGGVGGPIDDGGALDGDSALPCECASPFICDSNDACVCPVGYVESSGGDSCEDIDECATNNGGCDADATCTNTIGSFDCACNVGFEGDGFSCEDDCVVALATRCDANAVCIKPNGTAECRCASGYIDSDPSEPGTMCEEDPLCMPLGCDPTAVCDSSSGTPMCECLAGYDDVNGNGTLCTDFNECLTNNGGCDTNATCGNTQGGFTCSCNAGYVGDGFACDDVDECLTNNGGCGDAMYFTCANNAGAAPTCADIDECATSTDNCSANATCTNSNGGFTCACLSGFFGDGVTCTACTAIANCASGITCTSGSNQVCATCAAGSVGDGTGTCAPCAAGTWDSNNTCVDCGTIANCAVTETCNVTNGNNDVCPTCAPGYSGNGTATCTNINECTSNTDNCHASAMCTDTPGGFTCACLPGFFGNGVTCTACTAIPNCASGVTCTNGSNQTCTACAPGYIGDGTGACTACAAGTWDSNNTCVDCGTIANCAVTETCNVTNGNNDVCPTCAPGFRGNGTGACTACTAIANCASGLTCTTAGNQTCGTCAPGYVGDGSGNCTACAAGTYDNNNTCVDCGTIANCAVTETCNVTNGNNDVCPTCAPGFYGNGTGACTACTAIANCASGLTCTTAGNQRCATCAPGYVGDGSGTCTPCGAGTYDNNNVCTTCPQIANCAATETCNVTNGNNSVCPTCMPGFAGSGTGACTDIDECATNNGGCDTNPDACVNLPGSYECQCPSNYNDVNGNGTVCEERCTNCDANANCDEVSSNNFQCVCDASEGFTGSGQSCHCDLSGVWAVRIATTVDWPAVTFALQGGTATLYSYELRTLDYDGTTLDASILPCGGTDAPLCGTGLWANRAFGQQIPQSVWDSFEGNEPQVSMSLVNAVPDSGGMPNGTAFTTTNAAVYLGMEFSQHAITATTTNGSNTLTAVSPIDPIEVGMEVFLANVPAGALVTAVGATTVTLSQAATGTAAGARGLVALRQSFTANTTNGSSTITNISPLAKLAAGMEITMAGVPAGTRITAVVGSQATLSANANATASGVAATARVNPRFTANVSNGSATLSGIASTAHLNVGLDVVCAGVPAGTTITAVAANSVTLSANANATSMGAACLARVNDVSYWPPLGTANHIVFDDPEDPVVHDTIGAASNARTGAAAVCSNSHNYSRWPNVGNGNAFEVTAFRSGSRSVARFAGRVVSCDEIGGQLLGPDRNPANTLDVPRIDARFAGCTVTAGSNAPRPCTPAEVTAFNNQQKTQRVLSAEFSMVRVADNATCDDAINSTTYVDY